jgi:hypothetical protein
MWDKRWSLWRVEKTISSLFKKFEFALDYETNSPSQKEGNKEEGRCGCDD